MPRGHNRHLQPPGDIREADAKEIEHLQPSIQRGGRLGHPGQEHSSQRVGWPVSQPPARIDLGEVGKRTGSFRQVLGRPTEQFEGPQQACVL